MPLSKEGKVEGNSTGSWGREPWRRLLVVRRTKEATTIVPCIANVVVFFTYDPEWRDLLRYNEFIGDITTTRPAPWPKDLAPALQRAGDWTANDCIRAGVWLARKYKLVCTTSTIGEALHVVADRKAHHPVREWLKGLKWDRKKRADTFLIRLAGAEDSPYVRAVSKNFLLGAVARIMRPGCQVDTMPIFEGEQGIGKTTLLKILGGEWFMSTTIDPGSLDSYQVLRSKWIVELGELEALSRSEMARTKQYISQTIDRYRPSYGHAAIDFLRQVVFAGTVNPDAGGYLKDPTGARRFQPIELRAAPGKHVIDLTGIAAERDQLWAEAVYRFGKGEAWHFTDASIVREAAEIAEERRQTDPWEGPVAAWLKKLTPARQHLGVTAYDVLRNALDMGAARLDRAAQMRVSTVLRVCGWTDKQRVRHAGILVWIYRRPLGSSGHLRVVKPSEVGTSRSRLEHTRKKTAKNKLV